MIDENIKEYDQMYNSVSSERKTGFVFKAIFLSVVFFQILVTIFIFISDKAYSDAGFFKYFGMGFSFLLVNIFFFLFAGAILFRRK